MAAYVRAVYAGKTSYSQDYTVFDLFQTEVPKMAVASLTLLSRWGMGNVGPIFQAKARDLHMTPVCLEVIITKNTGDT